MFLIRCCADGIPVRGLRQYPKNEIDDSCDQRDEHGGPDLEAQHQHDAKTNRQKIFPVGSFFLKQFQKQQQSAHDKRHGNGAGVDKARPQIDQRIEQADHQEEPHGKNADVFFQKDSGEKNSGIHAQGVEHLQKHHEPGVGKPKPGAQPDDPVDEQGEGDVIGINGIVAFHGRAGDGVGGLHVQCFIKHPVGVIHERALVDAENQHQLPQKNDRQNAKKKQAFLPCGQFSQQRQQSQKQQKEKQRACPYGDDLPGNGQHLGQKRCLLHAGKGKPGDIPGDKQKQDQK